MEFPTGLRPWVGAVVLLSKGVRFTNRLLAIVFYGGDSAIGGHQYCTLKERVGNSK